MAITCADMIEEGYDIYGLISRGVSFPAFCLGDPRDPLYALQETDDIIEVLDEDLEYRSPGSMDEAYEVVFEIIYNGSPQTLMTEASSRQQQKNPTKYTVESLVAYHRAGYGKWDPLDCIAKFEEGVGDVYPCYLYGDPVAPEYMIADREGLIEAADRKLDDYEFDAPNEALTVLCAGLIDPSHYWFVPAWVWEDSFDKQARNGKRWLRVGKERIHYFKDYKERIEANKDKCIALLSLWDPSLWTSWDDEYSFFDTICEYMDVIESVPITEHVDTISELSNAGLPMGKILALHESWEIYEQARGIGIQVEDLAFGFAMPDERNLEIMIQAKKLARRKELSVDQVDELWEAWKSARSAGEDIELQSLLDEMIEQ